MIYAQHNVYPLQGPLLVWGIGAGCIGLAAFWPSALVGGAFFVLLCAVGCVWRRGEPPILAFCLAYQWLFIIAGYLCQQVTGIYPGIEKLGRIDAAVGISLLGLLVLVAGIRMGLHAFPPSADIGQNRATPSLPSYDVQRLCLWVIGLYTVNWFFHITPMTILFDAAQLLYNALAMRGIFLALLLFVVLQHQTGYGYAMLVFIYVLIPQFASMMSHFKESFFLLAIALCSQWHPWSPLPSDRRRSRYIAWAMVGTATALLLMAVLWEGGIKPRWRPAIMQGTVSGSPIQKLKAFSFLVQDATAELDVFFASQALVARLSSGVGFFSRVLDRVPDVIPYERGSLTLRALQHSVKPRFLFPDKPDLGSDSWLVWKYAGMRAAKETKDTSIGLGYMAEFYIDFGIPGMFAPLFAYGLLIGIVYRSVDLFAPSPPLFHSLVTIIFLQHFMSYEGEVAKLLGGLIQTWLLFLLFLYICGSWVHTHLQRRVETEARLYAH